MPESFDAVKQRLGRVQDKPYVPLSDRANSGNTGLLANLPGSYASKVASQAAPVSQSAPPKATDAPTKGQDNLFTGLADALNKHQKDLEKQHPGYVADEYVFEFSPAEIGASKVVPPAQPVNYKNTAAKNIRTAADKLDNNTDSVNVNSQTWQILAGTQIVQLIDQIMRSSSYITDQAKVTVEDDGENEKNQKANPGGVTAWYKISVGAQQLKYDTFRRDHAYRITFLISAYKINQMCSIYFNDSKYLGPHKAYDYWFTGLNTQILSYEQEYNQAYYTTVTQSSSGLASAPPTGRDQMKQAVLATSEQRTQGQANYVNAAADSAAAFLYSIADFAEVNMRILGDPAWMQQGEVAYGVSAKNFEFSAFNSDGAINYDSQQVTYTVSFNRPTDYDFNTGIMNTNSGTGAPQETFRFQAKSCKNIFSKGRFEQELVGSLIPPTTNAPPATNSRPNTVTGATNSRNNALEQAKAAAADQSIAASIAADRTGSLTATEFGGQDELALAVGAVPAPQPAKKPAAPTSSGDLEFGGDDTLQSLTSGTTTAPPTLPNGITSRLQRLNQPRSPQASAPQIIAKDD
jgi:hypothetical protein